MELAAARYEAAGKLVEPIPSKPMALTAPQERMSPSATHLTAEAVETLQVARDCVVVVIPLHHAGQPASEEVVAEI